MDLFDLVQRILWASTFQGTRDNESEYDEPAYYESDYGNSNAFIEYQILYHLLCLKL